MWVYAAFLFVVTLAATAAPAVAEERLPLETIKLPPGFHIDIYASGVKDARSLALSPRGTVFVGTRTVGGSVYALRDEDHDNRADHVYTIGANMDMPNGVAFRDGSLYVAEVGRIVRFDQIEERLDDPAEPKVVFSGMPYPPHRAHGWKYLAFGPDGWLYFGIGAPCNACEAPLPYAGLYRITPDGGQGELVARGIRNTVGFAWDPGTRDLWFTDNGRDMLGDDFPDDELNRLGATGMDFGFPYCHGARMPDPDLGTAGRCRATQAPVQLLGAHVAALGMKFYTGDMFPPAYAEQIYIAQHGSWNRSRKSGYRIMRVRVKGGKAVEYAVFAEGWLLGDGQVWGRPVDILVMPDGAMLVSDDHAGVIYRIWYHKDQ